MEHAIKRAMHHDEAKEKKRQRKLAKGLSSAAATPPATNPPTPGHQSRRQSHTAASGEEVSVDVDLERDEVTVKPKRRLFPWSKRPLRSEEEEEHANIKPSWRDINPLPTMWSIFKSPTNSLGLFSSGMRNCIRNSEES